MKKTAILIYDQFSNAELAPVIEILMLKKKPFTIFANNLDPVISEEGMPVNPHTSIDQIDINQYDSLVLPGAIDIRHVIEDTKTLDFIKLFKGLTIAAISVAPILLLQCGLLRGKKFMAGVNRAELFEEGFNESQLALMTDWDDNIKNPIKKGYIVDGNVITAVAYNALQWAVGFANMIGLNVSTELFGLD